jgi:hypothetical protein
VASFRSPAPRSPLRRLPALTACALALLCAAQALGATEAGAQTGLAPAAAQSVQAQAAEQIGRAASAAPGPVAAATLEQCVTSVHQAERSATFAGEMTAISDTARMSMRVDIEERLPGEAQFHMVIAPGLGVWRDSESRVKVYKYLKQVTNLSSPAVYRALVSFRWLNGKDRLIKRSQRLTPSCAQWAAPSATPSPSAPSVEPTAPGSG